MNTPISSTSPLAEATPDKIRSQRKAAYLTIAAGATHAVLFLLSIWLLTREPEVHASNAQLVAFYRNDNLRRQLIVGLYLMPFAGISFMWFVVALRMWIAEHGLHEHALFSNIQLVSGILYVALFFVAAGADSAIAASVEYSGAPVDPTSARELPQMGYTLLFIFAIRMAAMFVFTTTNIGRVTSILPKWFVILGNLVGLFLLLSVSFITILIIVFPVWLLALCGFLYNGARRLRAISPTA